MTENVVDTQPSSYYQITIPKLTELAMRTILRHVEYLGDLGVIEECFQQRIFSACTPDKLADLEHFAFLNSRKLDTEAFWERHCRIKLNVTAKTKKTWKETYIHVKQNNARKVSLLKRQMLDAEKKVKQQKDSSATSIIAKRTSVPRLFPKPRSSNWGNRELDLKNSSERALPAMLKKSFLQSRSKHGVIETRKMR